MKNPVKITLFAISSLVFCSSLDAFSQEAAPEIKSIKDSARVFVKLAKLEKYYTKDELNKLPKLDLIDIYKQRLAYLVEILPFISLHPEPGSTFRDMGIPETEANVGHLEKETKNKQIFVKSLGETLDDVIPYSEKSNIIWSIMFFDEMIRKSDYIGGGKGK
jgi:hypothetical protein